MGYCDAYAAPMPDTQLLLIRHGAIATSGREFPQRDGTERLSPAGMRQAAALAAMLASNPMDHIYSSPATRSHETARVVGRVHNVEPTIDPALVEVDMGDWAGRTIESVRKTPEWDRFVTDFDAFAFPAGESIAALVARTGAAIDRVLTEHRRQTVALVAHRGNVIAGLTHLLGPQPGDLSVPTASVTTVMIDESGDASGGILEVPNLI